MTEEHVSTLSIAARTVLVLIILAAAAAIYAYFILNEAHTDKTDDIKAQSIIVKTTPVALGTYPIKIEVMGHVVAARKAALKARVSGEIIKVSDEFIPGGLLKAQEEILHIDPSDYVLDVKVKKAALSQARAVLMLELGQQAIAKDELKIIEQSTGRKLANSDLALRKPQLAQARANVESAKASLALSDLNLTRTTLKAPFNALVSMRATDQGNVISPQDTLATLVSTDEFWIDAEIPVHNLRWLVLPQGEKAGSTAQIILDGGRGERTGALIKTTGSLNQQSHLAAVIISVRDPLLLEATNALKSPMILGDYVRVTLMGRKLSNTARILQSHLRNNNTIWLERGGKLIIQPIEIAYADRQYAYISKGLKHGDKIVTSNIITPIHGMDIVLYDAADDNINSAQE
ncbi:MAG: hypothetical protein COB14_06390 [Alphaproteobacteria bacterium]|nr:MAG: hypothetical protein COB14_06390 [Alphaproteobacteria bacterium]